MALELHWESNPIEHHGSSGDYLNALTPAPRKRTLQAKADNTKPKNVNSWQPEIKPAIVKGLSKAPAK